MKTQKNMFEWNISRALNWLFAVQDEDNFGWSWISDVSPNSQNTAEVVSVCSQLSEFLDTNQKILLCEAIENWLLEPSINGAIVIDYVWIMYALIQFSEKYTEFEPEFPLEKIYIAATECADLITDLQNEDGGWADDYGENSTSTRTALVVYCLKSYTLRLGTADKYDHAIEKAVDWLIRSQNEDGGWGNQPVQQIVKEFSQMEKSFSRKAISEQYLSQAVSTGYVLMALGHTFPHQYHQNIRRGVDYPRSAQNPDGSYDIFYEIGIRKDVVFTFRHFGTVWALKGLLRNTEVSFSDPCISKAIYYLIQLQDDATGGWKCTPESDVYTWSTANALSILSKLLYICDNAFCAELRDYVNDVVIQSIYLHADKTSDAKEASDGAQQQNEHIRFGIKPSWIALILKYLLLLAAIWISPKAALLIGILVLIDTIMILIKGDT